MASYQRLALLEVWMLKDVKGSQEAKPKPSHSLCVILTESLEPICCSLLHLNQLGFTWRVFECPFTWLEYFGPDPWVSWRTNWAISLVRWWNGGIAKLTSSSVLFHHPASGGHHTVLRFSVGIRQHVVITRNLHTQLTQSCLLPPVFSPSLSGEAFPERTTKTNCAACLQQGAAVPEATKSIWMPGIGWTGGFP